MSTWLNRMQAGIVSAPVTAQPNSLNSSAFPFPSKQRTRDPNAPDQRLDIEHQCVYERNLPGNAYITAHVQRLQSGFYDSPGIHGECIDNIRFLAVNFIFHPAVTGHRFKGAIISVAIHDDTDQSYSDPSHATKPPKTPRRKPKFLRFAPHILYGGISPETLDWNFNLAGSLGVSQTPVSASVQPSGGVKSSYKVYQMMRIQGSGRTLRSWLHHEYDIEDGEVIWTLEENQLQKSGLPREFTFVMLITKGDVENVVFDIEVEPTIATWFGHYPSFWTNFLKYKPLRKEPMDLDKEMGQTFEPCIPGKGFNFANLATTFDDFVSLPGTTYSTQDQTPSATQPQVLGDGTPKPKTPPANTKPQNNDVNVNVYFQGYPEHAVPSHSSSSTPVSSRRQSTQPLPKQRAIDIAYTPRTGSLRRSRSRTDLKDDQSRHSSVSMPQQPAQQPVQQPVQQRQRRLPPLGSPPDKRNRYSLPISLPQQTVNGSR